MFSPELKKISFLCVLFLGVQFQPVFAQLWPNGDFSAGTTNWNPVTNYGAGSVGQGTGCMPSVIVVGPPALAIDATAGELQDVPAGNTNAVQLFSGLGDPNHEDYAQVSQSATVPGGGNSTLSFSFAGVFENYHFAAGAPATEDAYLQINVNVGGNAVASLNYNWGNNLAQIVNTLNTNAAYYAPCSVASAPLTWGYVPWTNYVINLSGYVGQSATLQATIYDCYGRGHYGVGYLDNVSWVASPPSLVTLTKSSSPSGFVAGGPITYTLSYSNPAAFAVAGVEIDDTIPTGTTLVPSSVSSNPSMPITSLVGNDLIWSINSLAANTSGTLSFAVMPSNCPAAVTNTAHESDLDAGNITSNSVINTIATCTPSPTPTLTNTPTISPTPTNTATVTATFTPTNTPTPTPTYTPTCVTYVWPDPYNPKKAVGGTLRFSCMNDQTNVMIYTVSGELVQTLNAGTSTSPCTNGDAWGTPYCWNGRNKMGFPVATGIYLYVIQQGTQVVMRGKFLLMNTN